MVVAVRHIGKKVLHADAGRVDALLPRSEEGGDIEDGVREAADEIDMGRNPVLDENGGDPRDARNSFWSRLPPRK